MHSYPTDYAPAITTFACTLVFLLIGARLFGWYRTRMPRLRLLSGTRQQHAALRAALAPVLHEFLPVLDRAGQDVRAIVLVPTLSGDGEPLAAAVEQLGGSSAFIVRLAHRVGSTLRQPDEVAGVLAEDLLYLYRQAAAVTVVRQTGVTVVAQPAPAPRPAARNGLVALPRNAAQNEAEETVVSFKPNPLGRNNNQGS